MASAKKYFASAISERQKAVKNDDAAATDIIHAGMHDVCINVYHRLYVCK
jgi:hypothetical protein